MKFLFRISTCHNNVFLLRVRGSHHLNFQGPQAKFEGYLHWNTLPIFQFWGVHWALRQNFIRAPLDFSCDKTTRTAICFEHKTQYLLIRAPYTRIVVFWHISKIPPMIGQSQISCNTPTFCIATIFVKYCYTTGSWLS